MEVQLEKPSLEVAPTTSANILADREFSTGCYLFTVSNSGLLLTHSAVTRCLHFTFTVQSIDCFHTETCHPVNLNFDQSP